MRRTGLIVLALLLLMTGCQSETGGPTNQTDQSERSASTGVVDIEPEPTVELGWTSGESPVPDTRIGYVRAGLHNTDHAVSPTGIYFIDKPSENSDGSYIIYADNGSDTFIKLCGRPDCTHSGPDCNAYVYQGSDICYKNGYLYVISGEGQYTEQCSLIRMDPDGSDHVTVLDLTAFAKENNGDSIVCERITEGFCLFSVYRLEKTATDEFGSYNVDSKHTGYYYYMLDGSMEGPVGAHTGGIACYSCGDVFLTYIPGTLEDGDFGTYWDWDPITNEATFLTDHPGQPGWFGEEQGFYFMDGAIHRLTYATQTDEIMVVTGLEGDYYAMFFPDCVVVASDAVFGSSDKNLYFYNWSFELLDTVQIDVGERMRTEEILVAETADRLILSDSMGIRPKYYIDKADIGTGNVEIHEFKYA